MSKKLLDQFNCSKMMLSEHRSALKNHKHKPIPPQKDNISEELAQEFQYLITESLATGRELKIVSSWQDTREELKGKVIQLNSFQKVIHLQSCSGKIHRLKIQHILSVE
ncbi:hypothetical protein GGQ84_002804 [Desulfitispora alkaliphila]|uniref:YolD-like family protein n=1 Tax=Desulfitispora alkaliphila TaxID=622674 RepID=UPI003D1BDA00